MKIQYRCRNRDIEFDFHTDVILIGQNDPASEVVGGGRRRRRRWPPAAKVEGVSAGGCWRFREPEVEELRWLEQGKSPLDGAGAGGEAVDNDGYS